MRLYRTVNLPQTELATLCRVSENISKKMGRRSWAGRDFILKPRINMKVEGDDIQYNRGKFHVNPRAEFQHHVNPRKFSCQS